jgi:hypothetical protein
MKATELLALFCENVREMQEPDCETLRGVLHLRQKSILPLEILKLLKIAMPEGKEVNPVRITSIAALSSSIRWKEDAEGIDQSVMSTPT